MSRIVLSVVIFSVVVATAWALQCKSCKDAKDLTCKDLDNQTCPPSGDQEAACLIFKYKVDADAKEESIEKKCVTTGKDGKYQCIKTKSAHIETKCYTCNTDFCNEKDGASKIATGSLAVVSVLVALFAPKFL